MALGSVAMTRGDMTSARDWMVQAAALAEDSPDPWLAHGRLELAFGDKEVGRRALQRAIDLGDSWEARAGLIADQLRGTTGSGVPELLVRWSERAGGNPERRIRWSDFVRLPSRPRSSVLLHVHRVRRPLGWADRDSPEH